MVARPSALVRPDRSWLTSLQLPLVFGVAALGAAGLVGMLPGRVDSGRRPPPAGLVVRHPRRRRGPGVDRRRGVAPEPRRAPAGGGRLRRRPRRARPRRPPVRGRRRRRPGPPPPQPGARAHRRRGRGDRGAARRGRAPGAARVPAVRAASPRGRRPPPAPPPRLVVAHGEPHGVAPLQRPGRPGCPRLGLWEDPSSPRPGAVVPPPGIRRPDPPGIAPGTRSRARALVTASRCAARRPRAGRLDCGRPAERSGAPRPGAGEAVPVVAPTWLWA